MLKHNHNRKRSGVSDEREYLDALQRESWNLELIISGLALFGLMAVYHKMDEFGYITEITQISTAGTLAILILIIVAFSGVIVFTNLVIHLLLRGLWIGAVGLRSISGDIDFYRLRFTKPYHRFLKRRIGSFDEYIIKLDRLCSGIFAFSFLLALLLIGFVAFWMFISVLISPLSRIETDSNWPKVVAVISLLLYTSGGLIYLIDFLTLGWIKRIKWLQKIYYPVYRFFGFVTLARLYRPLYYNFIDDKFGRRVIWLAIPYILIIFLITTSSFNGSAYFDRSTLSKLGTLEGKMIGQQYYENLRKEEDNISSIYISADVISGPVLKITIPMLPKYNTAISHKFPDLPTFHSSIFSSNFIDGFMSRRKEEEIIAAGNPDYFEKYIQLFELQLNEQEIQLEDALIMEPQNNPFAKLVKYHPTDSLKQGMQQLAFTYLTYSESRDSLLKDTLFVPFYFHQE